MSSSNLSPEEIAALGRPETHERRQRYRLRDCKQISWCRLSDTGKAKLIVAAGGLRGQAIAEAFSHLFRLCRLPRRRLHRRRSQYAAGLQAAPLRHGAAWSCCTPQQGQGRMAARLLRWQAHSDAANDLALAHHRGAEVESWRRACQGPYHALPSRASFHSLLVSHTPVRPRLLCPAHVPRSRMFLFRDPNFVATCRHPKINSSSQAKAAAERDLCTRNTAFRPLTLPYCIQARQTPRLRSEAKSNLTNQRSATETKLLVRKNVTSSLLLNSMKR